MSEKVENRNRAVLDAALECARERGFLIFTRADVAARAGVATGSVNNAYGTMEGLRDAVMATAVENGDAAMIAQGLAARHPAAMNAPPDLKQAAAENLAA